LNWENTIKELIVLLKNKLVATGKVEFWRTKARLVEYQILRAVISEQAALLFLYLGGVRPPENPLHSWFGRVSLCAAEESWPMESGEQMHAFALVNLREFPFTPKGLEEIEFICIFIGPKELPINIHAADINDQTAHRLDKLQPFGQLTFFFLITVRSDDPVH
jgi:hypothetical protein